MSKASEWAFRQSEFVRRLQALRTEAPPSAYFAIPASSPAINGERVCGEVSKEGDLSIPIRYDEGPINMSPRQAIAFARWILDTYSEHDVPHTHVWEDAVEERYLDGRVRRQFVHRCVYCAAAGPGPALSCEMQWKHRHGEIRP